MNCAGINHFIAPYQERTQIVLGISALVSFLAMCILINLCGNLPNAWSQASGPFILTGALTLASLALFAIASCLPKEKYLKDPRDSVIEHRVVNPLLIQRHEIYLKEQIDLFIKNRAEINTFLPQGVVNIIGSYATSLESYFLGCPIEEGTLNKFKEDLYHLCTFADEIGSENN